jgi:hypothetical protein
MLSPGFGRSGTRSSCRLSPVIPRISLFASLPAQFLGGRRLRRHATSPEPIKRSISGGCKTPESKIKSILSLTIAQLIYHFIERTGPPGRGQLAVFLRCSLLTYQFRYARRSRLEKQPTDRRRKPGYLWDRTLRRTQKQKPFVGRLRGPITSVTLFC